LAEKSAQPKIFIEWIFDIERLQPLLIESNQLGGNRKSVCVNNGFHV
jgi:hypothetical protein